MHTKTADDVSPWVHVVLDVAGFVPALGEAPDFANMMLYLRSGEYLNALLSAISLMPSIGDLIAKPIKSFIALSKKVPRKYWQLLLQHAGQIRQALKGLRTVKVIGNTASLLSDTFESVISGDLADQLFDKETAVAAREIGLKKLQRIKRLQHLVKIANELDELGESNIANQVDDELSVMVGDPIETGKPPPRINTAYVRINTFQAVINNPDIMKHLRLNTYVKSDNTYKHINFRFKEDFRCEFILVNINLSHRDDIKHLTESDVSTEEDVLAQVEEIAAALIEAKRHNPHHGFPQM